MVLFPQGTNIPRPAGDSQCPDQIVNSAYKIMRPSEFLSPEREGEKRSYESREEEHESKLRERLKELIPVFLEIREKMGLGDDIGFGFLRAIHKGESLGGLPELRGKQLKNLKYSVPAMIVGVEYVNLSEQDRANVLLMPNLEAKNKRVVSVYDSYSDDPEVTNLLEEPSAIVGVITHELSHVFDGKDGRRKLPPEMQDVLKKRKLDFDSGEKSFGNVNEVWGNEEAEVDIIGALFGYKEQIVSKVDFMLQRLGKIREKLGDSYIMYAIGRISVGDLIQELEFRKQQVLEYCRV